MANNVFANNREISCKSGSGNTICAFPDVCFTPPENPATPPGVPIPYPNTGKDSDTTEGTKHVKITSKEVMLKNKSYFKTSYGDEAGCAAKKGVITSVNRGKVYFTSWSMDVKFEGENVVRHLDITTHNHASFPGNSPTWPFLDSMAFAGSGPCKNLAKDLKRNCAKHAKPYLEKKNPKNKRSRAMAFPVAKESDHQGIVAQMNQKREGAMTAMCKDPECRKVLKCVLSPKSPDICCPRPDNTYSKKRKTPHHIVPDSQFRSTGGIAPDLPKGKSYDYDAAPCFCANGNTHSGNTLHAKIHTKTNNLTVNHPKVSPKVPPGRKTPTDDARWSVADAEDVGAQAVSEETGCDKDCIKDQVRRGHDKMGIKPNNQIRPTTAGEVTKPPKPRARPKK